MPRSPLRRANVLEHISLLRRCFMPGKSPPCRILTLVAGNCKSFLFRAKRPRFSTETTAETRARENKPAQAAKTPAWGLSGQMSGPKSPAAHIEQSTIELPLHKKGDKPSGQKPPAQIPYGSRYGSAAKNAGDRRKTKEPRNRMNTRFPGSFTGRSDVT